MSGTQTGYIPTSLPSFPWVQGQNLDATPLNNQFYLLMTQLAMQATAITVLQAAVAAGGGGGTGPTSPPAGFGVSITSDWAGGAFITNGTYVLTADAPYAFAVGSIITTLGSAPGSFIVTLQINGVPITGLTGVLVSQPIRIETDAISNNVVPFGGELDMIIYGVIGTPTDCYVCVNSTTSTVATQSIGLGTAFGTSTATAVGSFTTTVAPHVLVLDDPVFGKLDVNPLG
jgi:hypothetical protein